MKIYLKIISFILLHSTSFKSIGQDGFKVEINSCEIIEWYKSFSKWDSETIDSTLLTNEKISVLEAKIDFLERDECFDEITSIQIDTTLSKIFFDLGAYLRDENYYDKAIEKYEVVVKLFEKNNIKNNLLGRTYRNVASIKRLKKDFKIALEHYEKSLAIYTELGDEGGMFDTYSEMIINYKFWGKLIAGQEIQDIKSKALNLKDVSDVQKIILEINTLLDPYIEQKEFEKATDLCDRSIELFKEKGYFQNVGLMLKNKADILIEFEKYEGIEQIFEVIQNLINSGKVSEAEKHFKAHFLQTKAAYHTTLKEYHQAQNYHQQILQFINPLFTYETIHQNPSPNQISSNPYLLTTLADKAEVFKKMYHQSGEIKNLKHALDCYQLSYTAADEMRKNYSFEEANTYLSSYTYSYFEKAIALCQQLAITYPEQESYYQQKAFEIAQRSSMKTLFWEINSRRADYHSLDDSTKTKKKRLQTNLVSLEDQLKNEPDNNNLKTQRFETRQALDRINQQLRNNIDGYANDQFCHFSDLSIEQKTIQNNLFPNEALLNYFMGDSLIYCFLATEENFQIVEIENPEFVAEQVFAFRRKIEESPVTKDLGYLLYKQLLENVLARLSPKINNLIIVPDGILSALPFEALQKSNQYHDFLINDYTISYDLHSYFLGQRKNNISPDKVNAVGFSVEDFSNWGRIRLPSLPYAKEEIESLIKNVGGKPYHLATKQQFLLHFQKPQIVHISSHAQADTIEASNSCIYFTQISNNESEDILTRNEILNYSCNAEMIVLSACETGLGKHNKGEGITSLARAFRTIGSKSEVMSLWKIGDNTTFKIITDFYKFLKEGDPKNKALRKAKINYLNNQSSIDHKMSPKNWAGLVLQGNVEPLF